MATYKHIASLIIKYRNNELTDKERKELEEWCALSEKNKLLFDRLNDDAYLAIKRKRLDSIDIDEQWEKISARLPLKKKTPWQVVAGEWKMAAAIITLLLGAGAWWFWLNRQPAAKPQQTAQQLPAPQNEKSKAVTNRIELKLADNKAVYLDGKKDGQIAKQKNAIIYKEGEWLRYAFTTGNEQEAIAYNTITTPNGKTFLLQLSDGSKIWMNAASSITFPTAFTDKERRVRVTGQVYFEVAHKKADVPFIVEVTPETGTGGCQVEVLGTHFDVNAYSDEAMIKTTLLQGKVRVASVTNGKSQVLKPGEQAQVRTTGELKVVPHYEEGVMSWKENKFKYNEQDIKLIMCDIARWYDYEIVYKDEAEGHYSLSMSRTAKVEQVLEVLEKISGMHFKIEGRQIIVTTLQG